MAITIPQSEIIPLPTDTGALGNRINAETRAAHTKIDKLMTLKFGLALRDPKIYRQGIQMYYHIFSAIEESLDREINANTRWSPVLREIYKPAIKRSDKLFSDLLFYYNNDASKFSRPMFLETIDFVQHIKKVTQDKPYLLISYLHVLYLALFAGGRIFRSKLAKAVRLFPQVPGKSYEEVVLEATNFFRFDVEDEDAFRIAYKRDYELQTRNHLTESEKRDIIEESKEIFERNATCVKEIESHNMKRLQSKMMYRVFTRLHYIAVVLLVAGLFYYARYLF